MIGVYDLRSLKLASWPVVEQTGGFYASFGAFVLRDL